MRLVPAPAWAPRSYLARYFLVGGSGRHPSDRDHLFFPQLLIGPPGRSWPLAGDGLGPITERPIRIGGHELTSDRFETFCERNRTTAILLYRSGELVAERYYNGRQRDSIRNVQSISKSFLSVLVGLAVDQGQIKSLDDPVRLYLPSFRGDDAITLRHLLTMTAGLRYDTRHWPWSDEPITYFTGDQAKAALAVPSVSPPGTRWLYSDYLPTLLALALQGELSAAVCKSGAVTPCNPVMPVADGLVGSFIRFDGLQL